MRYNEACEKRASEFVPIRRVQVFTGSRSFRSAFRDRTLRSGLPAAIKAQPKSAWSKTKAVPRFPRPWRLEDFLTGPLLPDQGLVGKTAWKTSGAS
jgi:hypothetical protein